MTFIAVFLGGGTGALCRYLLSKFILSLWDHPFPLGTFIINITGCMIIGILTALFEKYVIPANLRFFIFTGILGGFTTFSTFGLETFMLIKDNEIGLATANLILSNFIGIILLTAGYLITRQLTNNIQGGHL